MPWTRDPRTKTDWWSVDPCPGQECYLNILKILRRFSLANLFIQKLKFLTVRQKFKDCLEPFDVADIMEQYKSGHLEMLARVKVIQHQ